MNHLKIKKMKVVIEISDNEAEIRDESFKKPVFCEKVKAYD